MKMYCCFLADKGPETIAYSGQEQFGRDPFFGVARSAGHFVQQK